jgi:hypothetical protein
VKDSQAIGALVRIIHIMAGQNRTSLVEICCAVLVNEMIRPSHKKGEVNERCQTNGADPDHHPADRVRHAPTRRLASRIPRQLYHLVLLIHHFAPHIVQE